MKSLQLSSDKKRVIMSNFVIDNRNFYQPKFRSLLCFQLEEIEDYEPTKLLEV